MQLIRVNLEDFE